MVDAAEIRELESQLTNLKNKKSQLDSEKMRHEMELNSAKTSLENSLKELKELGFDSIGSAEEFIENALAELKELLTEAQTKIDGIVVE